MRGRRDERRRRGRRRGSAAAFVALTFAGALCLGAVGYVGFLLWPRWPATAKATLPPSLPITVSGARLNVPPAAIRFPPQRRAGAQPRLDLAFEWPQSTPPKPQPKPSYPPEAKKIPERIFLSIAGAEGALPLRERIRTIYARYMAPTAFAGPAGLSAIAFRDGTPYQGEDLLFDAERPEHFLVRCTRASGAAPGTCLLERPLGPAQLTIRFPRDWLDDWPQVDVGIERLVASLHPGA